MPSSTAGSRATVARREVSRETPSLEAIQGREPSRCRETRATHRKDEEGAPMNGMPSSEENSRVIPYPKPGDVDAEKQSNRPYSLWSPSQFFAYKVDPSASFLGDGLIERGEWTSLVGIGGLGKTRLALWFCICQITGREWCGIKTTGEPQKSTLLLVFGQLCGGI